MAPRATYRTRGLGDLLTVLPDEATVRTRAPISPRWHGREGLRGIIVTAVAAVAAGADGVAGAEEAGGPGGASYDFVSRFFAPARGLPEDPVTGSAHTALAPYWAERLGRERLVGAQVSERGGIVRTAVLGDRVHLTGDAVTVLQGVLV